VIILEKADLAVDDVDKGNVAAKECCSEAKAVRDQQEELNIGEGGCVYHSTPKDKVVYHFGNCSEFCLNIVKILIEYYTST